MYSVIPALSLSLSLIARILHTNEKQDVSFFLFLVSLESRLSFHKKMLYFWALDILTFVMLVTNLRMRLLWLISLHLASLLDPVANIGTVELGEVELAMYLADRRSTGKPFFRNGMCRLLNTVKFLFSAFCLSYRISIRQLLPRFK